MHSPSLEAFCHRFLYSSLLFLRSFGDVAVVSGLLCLRIGSSATTIEKTWCFSHLVPMILLFNVCIRNDVPAPAIFSLCASLFFSFSLDKQDPTLALLLFPPQRNKKLSGNANAMIVSCIATPFRKKWSAIGNVDT